MSNDMQKKLCRLFVRIIVLPTRQLLWKETRIVDRADNNTILLIKETMHISLQIPQPISIELSLAT